MLLVIISTIQPEYQCTICHSIAIHLYECHWLKQIPEKPIIIFKWGERRTQFHRCTALVTSVQSFSWLIYFHKKASISFKLLDQISWSLWSTFLVVILWIIYPLSLRQLVFESESELVFESCLIWTSKKFLKCASNYSICAIYYYWI